MGVQSSEVYRFMRYFSSDLLGDGKIGEDNPKGTRDPLRQWWWVSGMHRGLPVDYLDTYNNNDSDGGDEDDLRFCRIGLDPRTS